MKKSLLIAIAGAVVLAWLSLIPGFYVTDNDKAQWLVWVTTVAVITELGFWAAAATLGVAVFEARRMIWDRLKGRSAN